MVDMKKSIEELSPEERERYQVELAAAKTIGDKVDSLAAKQAQYADEKSNTPLDPWHVLAEELQSARQQIGMHLLDNHLDANQVTYDRGGLFVIEMVIKLVQEIRNR